MNPKYSVTSIPGKELTIAKVEITARKNKEARCLCYLLLCNKPFYNFVTQNSDLFTLLLGWATEQIFLSGLLCYYLLCASSHLLAGWSRSL
jgi:hypothetical protein